MFYPMTRRAVHKPASVLVQFLCRAFVTWIIGRRHLPEGLGLDCLQFKRDVGMRGLPGWIKLTYLTCYCKNGS